jgi:DtxR family Mn-dependent transcriptional regulator
MSEELEMRLFKYLGSPTHGAMGERILTIGKINDDQPTCPLVECDLKKSLKISWIEDDSELLRYFETLGLQLNDKVVILNKAPFSGPITLKKNSKEIVIGHMAASKIHMMLLEE